MKQAGQQLRKLILAEVRYEAGLMFSAMAVQNTELVYQALT